MVVAVYLPSFSSEFVPAELCMSLRSTRATRADRKLGDIDYSLSEGRHITQGYAEVERGARYALQDVVSSCRVRAPN